MGGSGEGQRRRVLKHPVWVGCGVVATMLAGLPVVLGGSGAVSAAAPSTLPAFPDNLVVFPDRDFVSIEGYSGYGGAAALLEVTRPGVGLVGSATATVSGTDVAFEINHPGGYCWGAGGGLKVTPDIVPGDVVSIKIPATGGLPEVNNATTVLDVQASDAVQDVNAVTVVGHIGAGVDPNNMEQRIIEAALVDTAVGKRDVRAVSGPLTPAPKGGYSSGLSFDLGAHTFTASYVFDVEADAHIAANAGLGERAMAWEAVDADGNRQGLTIAEFGEAGGPGVGGCPNGPLGSGPPGPTNVTAAKVTDGIKLNWTPAVALPGTPAIQGYRVTATAQSSSNNERAEIGKRITNPSAATTTLTGLAPGETYDIAVVSFSSTGETYPAVPAVVETDSTPPIVSASPAGASYPVAQQVTLTASELGSDIYYTLDGSEPVVVDQLGEAAVHYTGPIAIDTSTTLKFAAFDPSNNVSEVVTEQYAITNDPVAGAPSVTSAVAGLGQVVVNWSAADPGAPGLTITGYEVRVFDSATATDPVRTDTANGPDSSATVTGLTAEVPVWISVRAKNSVNSVFGADSARVGPIVPLGTTVANAGADQVGAVRGAVVSLSGLGSTTTAATYQWIQLVTATGLPMAPGVDKVVMNTPTARDTAFTLPLFQYPMVNVPLTFRLSVTANGVTRTDTVVVTPKSDTVSITKASWKARDFRVIGTASTVGAVVTARSATGVVYGTAVVGVGGAFDIRNKTNGPVSNPGTVYVDSNMGGTMGPFTVVNG